MSLDRSDPLLARLAALPGRDIDELRRERIRARCHAELERRAARRRRAARAVEFALASGTAGLMVAWALLAAFLGP